MALWRLAACRHDYLLVYRKARRTQQPNITKHHTKLNYPRWLIHPRGGWLGRTEEAECLFPPQSCELALEGKSDKSQLLTLVMFLTGGWLYVCFISNWSWWQNTGGRLDEVVTNGKGSLVECAWVWIKKYRELIESL